MASAFKTLDDLDLSGKRVLVRVDLNVPMADGKVADATRIERSAPTIRRIVDGGGTAILVSHFGRPKGKVDPDFSLDQVAPAVAQAVQQPVGFISTDWVDVSGADRAIAAGPERAVYVLENTRFHPGEEANDPELAQRMASLADYYVNDAFSAAHRAHASTEGVAKLLPSAAGLAMQDELEALEQGLGNPQHPVLAIVGGAKVSSKIELLENLVGRVDTLVIGGGMANTFLSAQGKEVGKSLNEKDLADTARRILDRARETNCTILFPVDGVTATEFKANADNTVESVDSISGDRMILDVGPASIAAINAAIDNAKTLVWNGPLGAFEMEPFDNGTVAVAQHAAERTASGELVSVAGGGDTVSALAHAGVKDRFTYVSTAGGAFLEWMEGKPLPGVEALKG